MTPRDRGVDGTDGGGKVLIVDDRPENLRAVEALLEDVAPGVVSVESGDAALRHLLKEDVALILMDVRMPDFDGFDTARAIKSREQTSHIPIIFVTAVADGPDEVRRGFDVGGVDYLTKPFDAEILRAKVRTFVDLHRRARRTGGGTGPDALGQVDTVRDEILARVSHEMRNPLSVIHGFASTLRDSVDQLDRQTILRLCDSLLRGITTLETIVEALQGMRSIDVGDIKLDLSEVDLTELVVETARDLRLLTDPHRVAISVIDEVRAQIDRQKVRQILTNLLTNAAKFSPREAGIEIRVSRKEESALVEVIDEGRGIPPKQQDELFRKYSRLGAPEKGTGLGLYISRGIALAHGGDLRVTSDGKSGCTFTLELPVTVRDRPR